jgi:drug/metabolite transporter (DMT)-like permease
MEGREKFGTSDFLMFLAVLFWAVNFSFIKIALKELSPLSFNGIRLFFASLVLILALLFSREGFSVKPSDFWRLFFLGLVGNTIFQMLFIHGLNWTTASKTSIVMALTPVFVALLSSLLKQEKIHWAAWMGIIISFVGFYLVITKEHGQFRLTWQFIRGDLMIFLGNLCWAIYTVFSRPLLSRMSPLKLTAITMAIGALFYLPFSIPDMISLRYADVSLKAWGYLAYSCLFALVISYLIWYISVKRVGNTKTAIYSNLTPVFTVIFAYLFISETVTLFQAAGALIIFVGVYFTRTGYRHFVRNRTI